MSSRIYSGIAFSSHHFYVVIPGPVTGIFFVIFEVKRTESMLCKAQKRSFLERFFV